MRAILRPVVSLRRTPLMWNGCATLPAWLLDPKVAYRGPQYLRLPVQPQISRPRVIARGGFLKMAANHALSRQRKTPRASFFKQFIERRLQIDERCTARMALGPRARRMRASDVDEARSSLVAHLVGVHAAARKRRARTRRAAPAGARRSVPRRRASCVPPTHRLPSRTPRSSPASSRAGAA